MKNHNTGTTPQNRRAGEFVSRSARRASQPKDDRVIIGLTGPMQHGKTELRPVIESLGFHYVDMNDFQNRMRLPGSRRYALYNKLIPGSLDNEGSETPLYYQNITPDLRQQLFRPEVEMVVRATLEYLERCSHKHIILSWEQLPLIAERLPLNHVVVMRQPKEVWYAKMKRRAAEVGFTGKLTDSWLNRMTSIMGVVPAQMLRVIRVKMHRRYSVLDVSPADWNAQGMIALLRGLARSGGRRR